MRVTAVQKTLLREFLILYFTNAALIFLAQVFLYCAVLFLAGGISPPAGGGRVPPCGAGYFPSDGKVTKGSPGTAPDEHFVLIVAFPRTPFTGVTA